MAYFPFPILPTNNPYIDFLISTSIGVFFEYQLELCYLERPNYKWYITRPTFNYNDLTYEGKFSVDFTNFFRYLNMTDLNFKGIRLLMATLDSLAKLPKVGKFEDYILLEIFKEIKRDIKDPDHVFDLQIPGPDLSTYNFNEELNELIFNEKENRRIEEENRRLEEEKRKSVHSFLKFIQNRIELVKQKKIFLEEMHKEKLKLINKQKIIEKQMKEYCFPDDDDLD